MKKKEIVLHGILFWRFSYSEQVICVPEIPSVSVYTLSAPMLVLIGPVPVPAGNVDAIGCANKYTSQDHF